MKKVISLILCSAVLLAILSGCGDKTGGVGKTEVQQPSATSEANESSAPAEPEDTDTISGATGSNGIIEDTDQPDESPKPKPPPLKPSPSASPEPPQDNTSDDNNWAAAYLDVIDRLISRCGEGEIEYDNYFDGDYMSGLGVVRLIDFDGNGTYELYCAYSDEDAQFVNKQVIYGCDNKLVTLMEECRVSNPGTDVSPSTTFLSKAGKVYLVEVHEIVNGRYLTVQNGKMVSVLDYYYDFWDEDRNSINGVPTTEDEVMYAISEMEIGGTTECINFFYGTNYSDLIRTQETIKKLRELAQ